MDYGTLRGILTVVVMLTFIGIFAWAYSARRHKQFDEAANLIFSDPTDTAAGTEKTMTKESKDSGDHN